MQNQKGFTLIELMIVIAIIGILASIAIPAYGNYIKRSKFAEVIQMTAPIKTAVELCYQKENTFNRCDTWERIELSQADYERGVVVAAQVAGGGWITLTGNAEVDGAQYALIPSVSASGAGLNWDDSTGTCRTFYNYC